jgi:hypothetical protein
MSLLTCRDAVQYSEPGLDSLRGEAVGTLVLNLWGWGPQLPGHVAVVVVVGGGIAGTVGLKGLEREQSKPRHGSVFKPEI